MAIGMGCIGLPVIVAYIGPLIASLLAIVLRPHLVMIVVTVTVTVFYSTVTIHFALAARRQGQAVAKQQDPGKAKELLIYREGTGHVAKHFAFCTLIGLTGLTSQLVRMRLARLRRDAAAPIPNP
ncbi:MAG TPA: hypothetical protein VJU16_00645 [Planctomycetota bacterium]|nr:hypothetical protein [Planctomycetota bacterium]